jgi:hypothetical protein
MRKTIAVLSVLLSTSAAHAHHHVPWCGIYARSHLVSRDPGTAFNLACNWLRWGRPTTPVIGAIVVWCNGHHHHVGKITGPCNGSVCVVTSGNDGNAVRTRARSVAGAAFRVGGL